MCGCAGPSKPLKSYAVVRDTVAKQAVVTNLKKDPQEKLQKLTVIRKHSINKCPNCGQPLAEVSTSNKRLICIKCRYTQ